MTPKKVSQLKGSKLFLQTCVSMLTSASRGYGDHSGRKVVVVTGASRGIGYATAKKMVEAISSPTIYCTTRGDAGQMTGLIREEVDNTKSRRVKFMKMDVSDITSVVQVRNYICSQHGQVDVLINNAGQYYHPANKAAEHFVQVQRSLDINYFGLKNVLNAFLPILSDTSRIVNMSSHLGHLSNIPGEKLRKQFADPYLTEKELDEMMMNYLRHCSETRGDFEVLGWPRCSYTVSKVAVNAYTRILQKQVEERGYPDIVVNSLRPGSQHSKVPQEGQVTVSASDAASSVVSTALLPHPCSSPRGQFIWHDLSVVDWARGDLREILEQEQSQ